MLNKTDISACTYLRIMCFMPRIIDKLYTQIGNVNRLHNIIEPFAALFWALGIVLVYCNR